MSADRSSLLSGRLRLPLALVMALVLLGVTASAASAADNWEGATAGSSSDLVASPDWRISDSNVGATHQSEEPLTPSGPGFCDSNGQISDSSGSEMDGTRWYLVAGTGGDITLTTEGSSFDTVLAVYDTGGVADEAPSSENFIACNDDIAGASNRRSRLTFATDARFNYLVQVGGFRRSAGGSVVAPERGTIQLAALRDQPANDNRGAARPLQDEEPVDGDNTGAGIEGGEPTACGDRPYGKTVWYRISVPSRGTLTASATGIDAVIALYQGGSGTPMDCRDDTADSLGGVVSQYVPAGEYFIQVGGFGSGSNADQGGLTVLANFADDTDEDRDGHNQPADCNDTNAAVHPGRPDVTNGVDDNCDGIVDPDRDGDGFLRMPHGNDCDDGNRFRNPGAREVRGNRIDENCDNRVAPFRRIEAVVKTRGTAFEDYTLIRSFSVTGVPRRARVQVRCVKPSGRSCGRGVKVARRVGFRSFKGDRVPVGSVIRVTVTKRGYIGFHQRLTARPNKRFKESRAFCINEGDRRRTPRRKCAGVR